MGSARCVSCSKEVGSARCTYCGAAVHAGCYEIFEVLAASPHGRTYRAQGPHGPIALKELVFALVPTVEQFEAFEREARVLSSISHPKVPRLVESFCEGEGAAVRFYLAQELVEGEALSMRIADSLVTEDEARDVADQVLRILADLHARGIVHRDIKPANLLRRSDGSISLVDYGAARTIQDVTHGATLVGTYGYMPPEQLGGTVDATADLYALGATLVHLLGGVPPADLLGPALELRLGHLRISPQFRRLVSRLTAPRLKRISSAMAALEELRQSSRPRSRATRSLVVSWLVMLSALICRVAILSGTQANQGDRIELAQRERAHWASKRADHVTARPPSKPFPRSTPEHVDITIGHPIRGDWLTQLHPDEPECVQYVGFDLSLVRIIRSEHRLQFKSTIYSDRVWCSWLQPLVTARADSGELARIGGMINEQRDGWRNRYDDFALPDALKQVRFEVSSPKGPVEAWRVNFETREAHRVGWALAGVFLLWPHPRPASDGCIERRPKLVKDFWIEFEALPLTLLATVELEPLASGQVDCPGVFGLRFLGPKEAAGQTVAPQGENELRLSVPLPGVGTGGRVVLEGSHRIASFHIDLPNATAEGEDDLASAP